MPIKPYQDWSAVRLSSFAERVTRRNSELDSNVLTISATRGLVSQGEYFGKRIASANLASYYRILRGEFAYNKSYSNGYPLGAIKRLDHYASGVVSPLYICFSLTRSELVHSDYFVQYIEAGYLEEGLHGIAAEGARNHGLLNVKPSEFLNLCVTLPPLPEQKKIAAVLSSVDAAIEKTEAVIAQLQVVKKAMMEQLLTKGLPGRHTRFKQTDLGEIPEDWEVLPLESIASVERGKFSHRPRNDPAMFNGQYPFIQTGDVAACDGQITRYSQTLNERGLQVSRLFPAGTIVITIAANIGDTGITPVDVAFPDSLVGIIANPGINNQYLELVLRSRKKVLEAQAPQNAQKNINLQVLRPLLIPVPTFSEQQEISSCLHAIAVSQHKEIAGLAALRTLKSSLSSSLLSGELRVPTDSVPCPV